MKQIACVFLWDFYPNLYRAPPGHLPRIYLFPPIMLVFWLNWHIRKDSTAIYSISSVHYGVDSNRLEHFVLG